MNAPTDWIENQGLPPAAVKVWRCLEDAGRGVDGVVMAYAGIADGARVSPRSVVNALAALEDRGLLIRVKAGRRYRFILKAGEDNG